MLLQQVTGIPPGKLPQLASALAAAAGQRDIGIVETRLTATGKELENAKAELAAAGSQASPAAYRRVEDVSRILSADAYRLSKLRTEEIRLNERFDDDAQRLRVLLGEAAADRPTDRPAPRQISTGDGR